MNRRLKTKVVRIGIIIDDNVMRMTLRKRDKFSKISNNKLHEQKITNYQFHARFKSAKYISRSSFLQFAFVAELLPTFPLLLETCHYRLLMPLRFTTVLPSQHFSSIWDSSESAIGLERRHTLRCSERANFSTTYFHNLIFSLSKDHNHHRSIHYSPVGGE